MTPIQQLFEDIVSQAREMGMTETAVCAKHIKMEPGRFNKIKNGKLPAPNHRGHKGQKLYKRIADFLGLSENEVLARMVFGAEEKKVGTRIVKLLDSSPEEMISKVLQEKMALIGLNSAGREECLDLVLDVMKSYIKRIRKEEWREL